MGAEIIELSVAPADVPIDRREVARLADCGPDPEWHEVQRQAIHEARSLLEPRARRRELSDVGLQGLFDGDTPVGPLIRAAPERWAFVATIGSKLETRVQEHFANNRFLEAVLLDAAGSVAADALCDLIEQQCAGQRDSTRFSPGHCGWALDAQRPLLGLLGSAEIGVRLRSSLLMDPLKSVSGIVARGPAERLRVSPRLCTACAARGCMRRQARYQTERSGPQVADGEMYP